MKESVVVAQDIATWQVRDLIDWRYGIKSFNFVCCTHCISLVHIIKQLCQCMEDLSCDADTSTSSTSILRGTRIVFGWSLLMSIMVISWIR